MLSFLRREKNKQRKTIRETFQSPRVPAAVFHVALLKHMLPPDAACSSDDPKVISKKMLSGAE